MSINIKAGRHQLWWCSTHKRLVTRPSVRYGEDRYHAHTCKTPLTKVNVSVGESCDEPQCVSPADTTLICVGKEFDPADFARANKMLEEAYARKVRLCKEHAERMKEILSLVYTVFSYTSQ